MIVNNLTPINYFILKKNSTKSSPRDAPTKTELAKYRILVIDSDAGSNSTHCLFLSKMGFTKIDITRTGLDAISKAKRVNYNLILIEILLPDMNGFKVCKAIRKLNKHQSTPIIAATSYTNSTISDACTAYGICEVLTKPFLYHDYKNVLISKLVR